MRIGLLELVGGAVHDELAHFIERALRSRYVDNDGAVVGVDDRAQCEVHVVGSGARGAPTASSSARSNSASSSGAQREQRGLPLPALVDARQAAVVQLVAEVQRQMQVVVDERIAGLDRDQRQLVHGLGQVLEQQGRRIAARRAASASSSRSSVAHARVGRGSPVTRSAIVPSRPSRQADQRFSPMRQLGATGSSSPAAWRSASHVASACTTAAIRRRLAHRSLRVGHAHLDRAEPGVQAPLPPPLRAHEHRPGALTPAQRLVELVERRDCRRHALPRQQIAQLRADRGQPGVRAAVERCVGGNRSEQRKVRAQRVVHGKRPVGRTHGDMHVQPEDELAPRDRSRTSPAIASYRAPALSAPSAAANGCTPAPASKASSPASAASTARASPSAAAAAATVCAGGTTISSCAAGSSGLKRGSPAARSSKAAARGARSSVSASRTMSSSSSPIVIGAPTSNAVLVFAGHSTPDSSPLMRLLTLPGVFRPRPDSWMLRLDVGTAASWRSPD